MPWLRSSLLLIVTALVAPSVAVAQSGESGGASTFSTISLMVFAAGVGAMAVSLARSRARSRPTALVADRHPGPAFKAAPERPSPRGPERLLEPAPETAPNPAAKPVARAAPEPAATPAQPAASPPAKPARPDRPAASPVAKPGPEPASKPARAARPAASPPIKPAQPAASPPAKPVATAAPEPAAAPAALPPAEQLGPRSCRVRVWSGYVKQRFYAEAANGEWVAQSPAFRLEKGRTLEDSPQAAAALQALLGGLAEAGWDVAADS
jgi:hypothetical protein